ncbi:Sec-independent protein translocase protein TatB [Mesorhizobium sp. CN2-181]|uniref:Sec-independent protein translocase protein TatB n=1 Tax=Mesorhizobium yinganensis TaxID=3157707 RepID=UPI0032B7D9F4
MFDIGWTEMLVIAVVMIVVVGPKDLPKMLRTFGKMTTKMRSMAGDFQKQFNEALKEAELDDVKKSVDALRSMNPANEIKKQLNPFEQAAADVRAGLQSAMGPKPSTSSEPATPAAHEAEPLKNGATAMPGVAGPEATAAPVVAPPAATAAPAAIATPMSPPEPAKPAAAAAPMSDPQPAKVNGSQSPAAPKAASARASKPKASTVRSAAKASETKPKTPARAKSAAAATAPAAAKATKPKPAASARKSAEKSK